MKVHMSNRVALRKSSSGLGRRGFPEKTVVRIHPPAHRIVYSNHYHTIPRVKRGFDSLPRLHYAEVV